MRKILLGGIFDLLHVGHIKWFELAKSFGDYLVVQVGSDQEARETKGIGYPIIPGIERAEMVRSVKFVDEVIYSDKILTWIDLLDIVNPDVIVLRLGNINEKLEEECVKRKIAMVKISYSYELTNTTKIIEKCKLA